MIQNNLHNILQTPVNADSKLVWFVWGTICLIIVAVLSVTSLVVLPLSIIGYTLFVISVLFRGLGGAFSSFGINIVLFFKHKDGTDFTPSWFKMTERLITFLGLLGLFVAGQKMHLALFIFYMYLVRRGVAWKKRCTNNDYQENFTNIFDKWRPFTK